VVGFEEPCIVWRKSAASASSDCVEVALVSGPVILVRDSADHKGPVLSFSPRAWSSFVARACVPDPGPG